MEQTKLITVSVQINAPIDKVWKLWTGAEHIMQWNNASDDWHTPEATNDIRPGGKFNWHMAAKDGSAEFHFEGIYDEVKPNELITYTIADGRKVSIKFSEQENYTNVEETFEPENTNPIDMQQNGWQAILNNFKKYVEDSTRLEKVHFSIEIDATPQQVYNIMLDDSTYRKWTAAFNPTSSFRGSWKTGSTIHFIGTDSEGQEGGMVSRIKENIPHQFVSIEHLGVIHNGKEIMSGKEVDGWAGSLEEYTYTQQGNKTILSVALDSNPEFKSYFTETYPKALKILKELCETH